MNPFKKLASQTAIYGLPTIIGRLLNYFLVPIYTRVFIPEEYGVVTVMYAYVSFLIIVLTYGMETALFNFSTKHENKEKVYSTILSSVGITSVLFIAVLSVFSQPIASLIQCPVHPEYIVWFALILGMDAVSSIAFAKLREQNKAKTFALIKTLNIAVNIFFNLFFIIYCKKAYDANSDSWVSSIYSPEIGIGYIFISNVIASAVTLLVQLPSVIRTRFSLDGSLLKTILPYALPLLVAGLAGMTNETMDRILLQYLLPSNIALEQVGIYGACYKISIIMTMFIQTFRFAAEPFFFSHAKEMDAKKVYARVMDYFVIICMIIFLGTMMNISWIQYFVGKDFRSGMDVVPILLLANFSLGVFFNLSIWYKLTAQTKWGAYLTIFGAIITLIGNFIFIPMYGYMASAWVTLVCYAGMMAVSYVIGNKYYPVNYDLKRILGYPALALLLFALSKKLEIGSKVFDLTVKNSLLLFFVIIVFIFERNNLLGHKNASQDHQ
ncbi:MAG: lipopolysaccharide biosynthesis protein [Bacteroidia bacterium]